MSVLHDPGARRSSAILASLLLGAASCSALVDRASGQAILAPPANAPPQQVVPGVPPQVAKPAVALPLPTPAEYFGTCGSSLLFKSHYFVDGRRTKARQDLDALLRDWQLQEQLLSHAAETTLIDIPVVVHVVFPETDPHVDMKLIESQIDALNRDFRADRTAADMEMRVGGWANYAADAHVEFHLAKRTPDCHDTNGVTYLPAGTATPAPWVFDPDLPPNPHNDDMKHKKGAEAWDPSRYLNIWVCHLEIKRPNSIDAGRIDGFATFPPAGIPSASGELSFPNPPDTDGVVIDWRVFGQLDGASNPPPLDQNRLEGCTTSHEVGHWLDLLHPWGTCESSGVASCDPCAAANSDLVDDTPAQTGPQTSCTLPSFVPASASLPESPTNTCGPDTWPDLCVDLMDYSMDGYRSLFTPGQVDRIRATLHTSRATLLGSQGGIVAALQPDLWMRDAWDDLGAEPDPTDSPIYDSPDIWARTHDDGMQHQEHEPLLFNGLPYYIYVRVSNRGCGSSDHFPIAKLHLYWAKAAPTLHWPDPWAGADPGAAPEGGEIGAVDVAPIAGNDCTIMKFEWTPPAQALGAGGPDVSASPVSLLARIETTATPPYGMTTPEGPDLEQNVRANNNIAWKNVVILAPGAEVPVLTGNDTMDAARTWLKIRGPLLPGSTPPPRSSGRLLVHLDSVLAKVSDSTTRTTTGFAELKDDLLALSAPEGVVGPFVLGHGLRGTWTVRWVAGDTTPLREPMIFDVAQWTGTTRPERFVAGQLVVVSAPVPPVETH